jgi:glutathione-regulated potassium-efflux system ancillary protein KefG
VVHVLIKGINNALSLFLSSMASVLILFAHPALEKSRIHARMIRQLPKINGVSFHDLYESYPDFDIDVKKEKSLLLAHDIIIFQHPFYWYSAPAIIKQWMDLVLEHGWAYGPGGTQLHGKKIFQAISCGGSREAYAKTGRNRFTIMELLAPFEQTAQLCHMIYLPPFVIHGTHKLRKTEIEVHAVQFEQLLSDLVEDRISENDWKKTSYLNDLLNKPQSLQS